MENQKNSTTQYRSILVTATIIAISACGVLILFFLIFPMVDAEICVSRMSNKISAQNGYGPIYKYIEENLITGLTDDEVFDVLMKLGSVRKVSSQETPDGNIRNTYRIGGCIFPWNNLIVMTHYQNQLLESIFIEKDVP